MGNRFFACMSGGPEQDPCQPADHGHGPWRRGFFPGPWEGGCPIRADDCSNREREVLEFLELRGIDPELAELRGEALVLMQCLLLLAQDLLLLVLLSLERFGRRGDERTLQGEEAEPVFVDAE